MTLNEFKHWLDGFEEAMGDAPTPEQWAKIKAKLGAVKEFGNLGKQAGGWPNVGTPRFGEIVVTADIDPRKPYRINVDADRSRRLP